MESINGKIDKTFEDLANDQSRHNDDLINEVRSQLQAEQQQGDHKSDPPRDEQIDSESPEPTVVPVSEDEADGDSTGAAGLVGVPLWVKLSREGNSRLVPTTPPEKPRKRGEDEEE